MTSPAARPRTEAPSSLSWSRAAAAGVIVLGALTAHGGAALARLGFYHDDWPILVEMGRHSVGGLPRIVVEMLKTSHLYRPTSPILWGVPFRLFGAEPLPWHLSMAALSAGAGLALFSVLRGLGASVRAAACGALIFLAFPNKDSTLFWPAVSLLQTASVLLLLLGYREHLRFIEDGGPSRPWRQGVALTLALATYEQGLFLLPLWLLAPGDGSRRRRSAAAAAAAFGLVALYKFALVPALTSSPKTPGGSPGHALFVYYMAFRAVLDPRWWLYLARVGWQGLSEWAPLTTAAAALIPLLAWRALPDGPSTRDGRLLAWGAAAWTLSYLPFAFSLYAPGAYDHMNRLNQLPAVGLAAAACGAGSRRLAPALAAACLALSPAFAEIWAESYRRQLEVREAVLRQPRAWPPEAVLLVSLPEHWVARKAPVFISDYDAAGALALWTGEPGRSVRVLRTRTRAGAEGLETDSGPLPYGRTRLLDMTSGAIVPLDRRRAASLPPPLEPWETPLRLWPSRGPS